MRGCAETEGKDPKLIYLVHEGKIKVLLTAWIDQYMKVCILQINFECQVSALYHSMVFRTEEMVKM